MVLKGKASAKINKVFLRTTATVSGPKEKEGPLGAYLDFSFDNMYCDEENWEQAEMRLQKVAIELSLAKSGLSMEDIKLVIGGDLNNQLAVTNYNLRNYDVLFFGVYAACSTCVESMILSSLLVDAGFGENIMAITSSHNATSERQFRYPTEYGGQKPNSMTSTATGAGVSIISKAASPIKITGITVGKVVDPNLFDSQDMGRTMAPAAAMTFKQHLEDFEITPDEYDLILTGDLSKYGSDVFKDILSEFGIKLGNNYQDAGNMLYDIETQNVFAGGSGCGCISLVGLGYVVDMLKNGVYNKVLLIATGALMNPVMIAQNESIPAIAHAIVLERSKI